MLGRIFQRNKSSKAVISARVVSIILREDVVRGVLLSREKYLGAGDHTVTSACHVLRSMSVSGVRDWAATDIISFIVLSPEIVINRCGDPVFEIRGTLGQYTLGGSLDIRSQNTIIMRFVELEGNRRSRR